MRNKLLTSLLATTMFVGTATAQTANSGAWGVKNPLFDTVAGKLNLTANVGYVYNFDSKWDSEIATGKANGGFGYGARIGWTNTSGFGISGDYLGFTSKWSNGTTEYTNPYHVITITPSYRFSFGETKEWGLKVGLGVGMSLADVTWGTAKTAKGASGKVAGGALYQVGASLGCGAVGAYSDSIGGTKNNVTFTSNQCKTDSPPPSAGPSDKAVADTLLLSGSSGINYFSGKISFGLWRRLGTNEANAEAFFKTKEFALLGSVGTYTGNFESRADYVARCGEAAASAAESGGAQNCVASGASSGGSAKDDAGFVLAPEIALEYDNGLLHADINARYIHGLANVKYDGQNGTSNQLQKSGPLAVFVGAGFGVNF